MSGRAALLVHGGWEGHEPEASVRCFVPFLEGEGFTVTLAESLAILDEPDFLATQHLIVPCWTMGALSESQETNLLAAIEGGVGLAGWHGGMGDAFRANPAYQFMCGGQFVAHPGNIIDYRVHITRPDDAIMEDLVDFPVHSEQYYLHVDPSNDVLATTTFTGAVHPWIDGVVMPVVWKRRWGTGRVFYSALGHAPHEFEHPETFTIMTRGMLWAARD